MENNTTPRIYTTDQLIEETLQYLSADKSFLRDVCVRGIVTDINLNNSDYMFASFSTKDRKHSINLFGSYKNDNRHIFNELAKYANPLAGYELVLKGKLNIYYKENAIKLSMIPYEILNNTSEGHLAPIEGISLHHELMYNKIQNGYKDISDVLEKVVLSGNKLQITLVRPKQDTVQYDIEDGLGQAQQYINIIPKECNFNQPEEIAKALKMADESQTDLVVMARGGGDYHNLLVLDNPLILKQMVEMKKPLIVGLGHKKDHFFAESLADRACSLPHDVGTTLAKLYKDKVTTITSIQEARNAKQKLNDMLVNRKESFYGVWGTTNVIVRLIIYGLIFIGLITLIRMF